MSTPLIRPVGFGGHKKGAIISVVIKDQRRSILIAGRDRLRLFGSMLLALDSADRRSMIDLLECEEERHKREGTT